MSGPGLSGAARRRLPPAEILALDASGVDELLDRLESEVPVHTGLVDLPSAPLRDAVVFGDTHGDWWSTVALAERFLAHSRERCLIGLGDYIDRPPDDCPQGSAANVLFLLQLVAEAPDRVFLLQGNHEAARRIPVLPHDLPEEVDELWGPDAERYNRIVGLLERGPLAALSPSGAYLAHGGFPSHGTAATWRNAFESPTEDTLVEVLWSDCAVSRVDRGLGTRFTARDLDEFFGRSGARLFLRGHDPDIVGRPLFDQRVLTLHSTRIYERYGGVIVALLPLHRTVRSAADVRIEHLETEGQSFAFDSAG
ncbi:MAG TPA: metallophosphoesterase [Thermoplasmata archaeon]|nr:metallophosphoesterase [Thermoplasmata archaeon]